MKKLIAILFIFITIFGQEYALCSEKTTQKLYNYNNKGQRCGYTQITYSNNKITRIETRDNGGRRLKVSKK